MTRVSSMLLVLLVLLLAASFSAFAQIGDPPLWSVVSTGTANQFSGQNFLLAGEVNKLGVTNEVGLYVQGGDPNNKDFNPYYLILGFVNASGSFTAPSITSETVYDNAGTPSGSGIINAGTPDATGSTTINPMTSVPAIAGNGSAGNAGPLPASWTGSPDKTVYDFLGLTGAGGSESFTNWSAAEAALTPSITASSFMIAVYNLSSFTNNANFTGNGLVDVAFNSTLPVGTMVVGYGCQGSGSPCTNASNPFANPFTQSGIVNGGSTSTSTSTTTTTSTTSTSLSGPFSTGGVPEPSGVILFGSALLGLSAVLRKKFIRS